MPSHIGYSVHLAVTLATGLPYPRYSQLHIVSCWDMTTTNFSLTISFRKFWKFLREVNTLDSFLSQRWGLVICDEVQDTSEDQWRLLQIIALRKLLLLGDHNQMIYTFLPGISSEQFYQIKNSVDLENRTQAPLP